ncbi:BLUF domain-containing protein [Clavibacter michiganensis]|nr:BLUF domain-containing protein [Clavibacter michiganensis]
MLSIVYSSNATGVFTDTDLAQLLQQSRASNADHGVTGLLVYRDGRFLQLLEGDKGAVRERMAVIANDTRHDQVRILLEEHVDARQFPDWTMAFARPTGEDQSVIPGFRATFDDLATEQPEHPTQPALRALIRWFQNEPTHLN